MAVKTVDYTVNVNDFTVEGLAIDANKKTAIRIDGITAENVKDVDMQIVDGNLEISYDGKKAIVSNYSKLKYIKTDYEKVGKKETYNLFDFITNNAVDNTSNPITTYNAKKLTVSGTNYNDKIDLSLSDYTPVGAKNIKANKGKIPGTKITQNITWVEMLGHDNTNAERVSELNIGKLANVYTIAREMQLILDKHFVGKTITISSGWRSVRNNQSCGGVANSKHLKGLAMDFSISGYTASQLATFFKGYWRGRVKKYTSWVHVQIDNVKGLVNDR